MFVLTGEGHRYLDRDTWTTHRVIAVGEDRDDVLSQVPDDATQEDIFLLTDMTTGTRQGVDFDTGS